jgi:hypothetical protein
VAPPAAVSANVVHKISHSGAETGLIEWHASFDRVANREGHFMTAHTHTFPADPTLEALRIQRDAYTTSGGEGAAVYDKLRDELVVARQRLSDQEKVLATTRLDLRAAMAVPQGQTLVQPIDAKLDEAG